MPMISSHSQVRVWAQQDLHQGLCSFTLSVEARRLVRSCGHWSFSREKFFALHYQHLPHWLARLKLGGVLIVFVHLVEAAMRIGLPFGGLFVRARPSCPVAYRPLQFACIPRALFLSLTSCRCFSGEPTWVLTTVGAHVVIRGYDLKNFLRSV